jgi:hypothetical protein
MRVPESMGIAADYPQAGSHSFDRMTTRAER